LQCIAANVRALFSLDNRTPKPSILGEMHLGVTSTPALHPGVLGLES